MNQADIIKEINAKSKKEAIEKLQYKIHNTMLLASYMEDQVKHFEESIKEIKLRLDVLQPVEKV